MFKRGAWALSMLSIVLSTALNFGFANAKADEIKNPAQEEMGRLAENSTAAELSSRNISVQLELQEGLLAWKNLGTFKLPVGPGEAPSFRVEFADDGGISTIQVMGEPVAGSQNGNPWAFVVSRHDTLNGQVQGDDIQTFGIDDGLQRTVVLKGYMSNQLRNIRMTFWF